MTAPVAPAPRPRWGVQASLFQPRQPAFWLYVLLLGIGGYIFVGQQLIESQLTTAYLLSWALVVLYAIPVAFIVYRLDLFEREPKLLLAAAVIWGGVIATSLALNANAAWLSILGKLAPSNVAGDWGAAIVGPGVEETLKLMGVAVLYLIASSEFDGVLDGFVYGAMIGLGFTVVEDVSYFMNNTVAVFNTGMDETAPVINTFLIRVVGGGLYSHVLFTGLTGMGLAYFVTRRNSMMLKRLIGGGLLVVAGVTAHVVWNSPWMASVLESESGQPTVAQWIVYGSLKGLPFLLLLGLLVVFATKSEESNFRAIVAGEPDPWIVTEPEIASLRSLLARRAARTVAGRQYGSAGSKAMGKLQSAQIEYALIRSRVDSLDDPALEAQRRKIHNLRYTLAALPPVGRQAPAETAPVLAAPVVAVATLPMAVATAQVALPTESTPVGVPAASVSMPGPTAIPDPAPASAVAVPPPPAPAATWTPTHLSPPAGMAVWDSPDPSRPPIGVLPPNLGLVVDARAGAWAQVRVANGWRGWVDGRRLVERR